jgi:hypothetical protein
MFQSLRKGTPLYVLHKNEPRLEVGEVTFVSNPTAQFGQSYQMGNLMGQPPTTVDVNIKVEGQEKPIEIKQLPASLSIADYGNGMVISESKESILNEIGLLKSSSQKVIDSIDQHRKIVQKCDTLLQELNPQIKQEAERSREIESLSKRVGNMESSMGRIEEMLSRALNNKKGN